MSEVITNLLRDFEDRPETHPLVVLGQMERVGSNFYLDMLEQDRLAHNEPYKQLIPESWPIARGYQGEISGVDDFLGSEDVDPAHKLWLLNFVASRYEPGGQLIKETNLYFAVPNLLELFPYRQTEVLSRHPLGIVSSFKRSNLFERWNYQDVADTLRVQARSKGEEFDRFFVESDDWQEKLTWLIGLNGLLISRALQEDGADFKLVRYQDIIGGEQPEAKAERDEDSIFGTNIFKQTDDFSDRLSPEEISKMSAAAEECIDYVTTNFGSNPLFESIFTYYFDQPVESTQQTGAKDSQNKAHPTNKQKTEEAIVDEEERYIQLDTEQEIEWNSRLVTNSEMQNFLNDLLSAGLDPDKLYLFLRHNMPESRGGRLQYDEVEKRVNLVKGYENHPAYWVTWLAAALYAEYAGRRLPTSEEYEQVFEKRKQEFLAIDSNHSYQHDDTVPTGEQIDNIPADFFGNLKIWCSDWADGNSEGAALSKKAAGISWKHYYSDTYEVTSEKPFLTNTRVIGIRLVKDRSIKSTPVPAIELLARFNSIIGLSQGQAITGSKDLYSVNRLFDKPDSNAIQTAA